MRHWGAGKCKPLYIVCALLLWQAVTACSPAPTPTPIPTPTLESIQTPSATLAAPTQVGTAVAVLTPAPTVTLSANAEQELVNIRAAARDAQGGFLFYLDSPARTSNPQVLAIPEHQTLKGVALAGNYGVKEHDFSLLCIVDYAEVPCQPEASGGFQFHLASGEETRLALNLALDRGTHDLLFLTFYDPTNHSTEQSFRQDSRFLFSFYRVQVQVGGVTPRPQPSIVQRFSTKSDFQPGAGVFTISRDKFTDPSQAAWHRQEITVGAPLNFFAAYSNPEQVTRTVALMAFLDFKHVPWDSSRTTYFAELDAGARADIEAHLSTPTAVGDHELVVVAVDNPFLDLAGEVNAAEPRSFFANSSDRVLIAVH